ncbi:MAG: hypothetical protein ACO3O1_12105, partial [Ilumatobacteraceae bacterium]
MIWPSDRRLALRLADLRAMEVAFDVDQDLVARLRSLAIASSADPTLVKGRWKRRVGAAIGAVGVFGWAGAAAAGASVGLVSTGSLPDPIQNVVADVLEVVNIEVPRPVSSVEIVPEPVEEVPVEETPPAEPPVIEPTPTTVVEPDQPEEEPVDEPVEEPIAPPTTTLPEESDEGDLDAEESPGRSEEAPGQTGATPGQSGTTPGQSGNTPAQGAEPPGQTG